MNILVLRGGAIGDFILTLPALTALRELASPGRLEVLGYPHIASLALTSGIIDAVRSIESPSLAQFFVPDGHLNPSEVAYFAGFQTIVSYLYDPDKTFQQNVMRCTSARYIVGPHRPDESRSQHATEVNLEPLIELGVGQVSREPRLFTTKPAGCCSEYSSGVWLAVHPGSGSERKNWPEAKWLELLKRLPDEWQILLVGGEAEVDRLQRLMDSLPGKAIELALNLPLPDLAQRMRNCRGFIGHDSGISHLAAAAGLPGLVLWGETVQEVWSPRSPKMCVLKAPHGLEALEVYRVLRELHGII